MKNITRKSATIAFKGGEKLTVKDEKHLETFHTPVPEERSELARNETQDRETAVEDILRSSTEKRGAKPTTRL